MVHIRMKRPATHMKVILRQSLMVLSIIAECVALSPASFWSVNECQRHWGNNEVQLAQASSLFFLAMANACNQSCIWHCNLIGDGTLLHWLNWLYRHLVTCRVRFKLRGNYVLPIEGTERTVALWADILACLSDRPISASRTLPNDRCCRTNRV